MISVHVPTATKFPPPAFQPAVTRDGTAYHIRPIRESDRQREREFICGLSEESRYFRLMQCLREVPDELVEQLVHIDQRRTMAFVAVVGEGHAERFIGVARYSADDSTGAAEFAVVVADDWQSRGVGTRLMHLLFEHARAAGFKRIYGMILANNLRMIGLARWLGLELERDPTDARTLIASHEL